MLNKTLIAGVRSKGDFLTALKSNVEIIFVLNFQNIQNLDEIVSLGHSAGKKIFVHFDFLDGVGKDRFGLRYIKSKMVDGIITTKTNIIIMAKEEGLLTLQRFFIVDSKAVGTALDAIKTSDPDLIEIMPGLIPEIIKTFVSKVNVPIIAGGLIGTKEHIENALRAGAAAVSTGTAELWNEQ